jgi:hypothetical protein
MNTCADDLGHLIETLDLTGAMLVGRIVCRRMRHHMPPA